MIKTLWQRYMADTPDFWKKVNLFGLFLGGLVAIIDKSLPQTPHMLLGLLAGLATATVAAANLAVKDAALIADPSKASVTDVLAAINDVQTSIKDVKTSYTTEASKPKVDTPVTLDEVVTTSLEAVTAEEDWRTKLHNEIAAQKDAAIIKAGSI